MSALPNRLGKTTTEVAAHAACPRVGYYFKVTPRLGKGYFWVGAFPDIRSANEARSRSYPWPQYFTDSAGYFTSGSSLA